MISTQALGLFLIFGGAVDSATPPSGALFQALRTQVASMRESVAPDIRATVQAEVGPMRNCAAAPRPAYPSESQYIYNADYSWAYSDVGGERCIFLMRPEVRLLTKEEAYDLLLAGQVPLPPPPEHSSQEQKESSTEIVPRHINDDIDVDWNSDREDQRDYRSPSVVPLRGEPSANAPLSWDPRQRITNADHPFYALTYVQTDGSSGSAIQISPYVYMTAAHVIQHKTTGQIYQNAYVFPQYQILGTTPALAARSTVPDPAYFPGSRTAHDLGFILVPTARYLPLYPRRHVIVSAVDRGIPPNIGACWLGDPTRDAFTQPGAINGTWYNGYVWSPTCVTGHGSDTITAGYPQVVGGQPNTSVFPYQDATGTIISNIGVLIYELLYPGGTLPVIGLSSTISAGDSGGPVFGRSGTTWKLLGVNSGVIAPGQWPDSNLKAVAAGIFDYNRSWIDAVATWTPGNPIVVTSPEEGGVYPAASVPDLVATAGTQTAQIRWSSSIDGFLGTGGVVPVANRLSFGAHTITASINSSAIADVDKAATTIIRTIHITVTPQHPTQPIVSANPNPVVIPYGASGAYATISWTSVCTGSCNNWRTDIKYSRNGATPVLWKDDAPAGSDIFLIEPGDVVVFYAFQHHYGIENANTVTVRGRLGASPTFSMCPTTTYSTPSSSRAAFAYKWSAEGQTALDLWGQVNNGPWQMALTVGETGSTGDTIAPGNTYRFRFYRRGESTTPLGSLSVVALPGPAPGFRILPSTVQIPATETDGPFVYSWGAPGCTQMDLWGKVDDGPWEYGLRVSSPGSSGDDVPLGHRYSFRFYLPGTDDTPLGELTVNGVAASSPTFSINPAHVVVPAGSTTGPFTFTWNAPGYPSLDLWGKVNNGPWQFGLAIPASGSSGDNIPVGSTYQYRFYPPGNSTHILGTLSVYATH